MGTEYIDQLLVGFKPVFGNMTHVALGEEWYRLRKEAEAVERYYRNLAAAGKKSHGKPKREKDLELAIERFKEKIAQER